MFVRTIPVMKKTGSKKKKQIKEVEQVEQVDTPPVMKKRKKKNPNKHPSRGYGGMMPFPPTGCLGHIIKTQAGKRFVDLPTCLSCKWNPCERRKEFDAELKEWHRIQAEKRNKVHDAD